MSIQNNKIFSLIPNIMSDVGAIAKSRKNTGQGYAFRGIDDVYAALQEPLARHGVFFTPNVLEYVREERQGKSGGNIIYTILKVEFNFYADDGSTFKVVTMGEAMDSGDKSCNKAMSAALKYALLQTFCIPTEDPNPQNGNDTEGFDPEPSKKKDKISNKPAEFKPDTTSPIKPIDEESAVPVKRTKSERTKYIWQLHNEYMSKYPNFRFGELLKKRYNVSEIILMSPGECENLIKFLEEALGVTKEFDSTQI